MGLTRLEITTSIGRPANLGCYANQTNTTSLTYSWSKDNLTVTQSSNIKVYGNVLVVTPKKKSDFGMYECHVTDGVAITKCNITLLLGCNNTGEYGKYRYLYFGETPEYCFYFFQASEQAGILNPRI